MLCRSERGLPPGRHPDLSSTSPPPPPALLAALPRAGVLVRPAPPPPPIVDSSARCCHHEGTATLARHLRRARQRPSVSTFVRLVVIRAIGRPRGHGSSTR